MAKFKAKPPIVEAVQFHHGEQPPELAPFARNIRYPHEGAVEIKSPLGVVTAVDGDWIVVSAGGALSVMKPDKFEALYEPA